MFASVVIVCQHFEDSLMHFVALLLRSMYNLQPKRIGKWVGSDRKAQIVRDLLSYCGSLYQRDLTSSDVHMEM